MCNPHWRMVPRELQLGVWRAYTHGQENDLGLIRSGYRDAVTAAVEAVASFEARARNVKPTSWQAKV